MTNLTEAELRSLCYLSSPEADVATFPANCQELFNAENAQLASRILMTLIFSSLSIIGVVGNILVITVVLRVKGMKTPTNCYLVSLAMSDSLFFLATLPTELEYLLASDASYPFGKLGCSVFTYLPYLAINSSSLSILAFTIERYYGICRPLQARKMCTIKRAKIIICSIWLFSFIYNSPWLKIATVAEDSEGLVCTFALDRDSFIYKGIYLSDFGFFYVLPMSLNVVIYIKIAITLSSCNDKLKQSVKPKGKKSENLPFKNGDMNLTEGQVSGKRTSTKGKNQVVKMLAVVVFVFAICWLPYRAMVMYNSFAANRWHPDWYVSLSKTMIFINCAINPILYNLMSARFRGAFKSIFKKSEKTKAQQYPFSSTFVHRNGPAERRLVFAAPSDEERTVVTPAYSPV